jgi:hypothetical protein
MYAIDVPPAWEMGRFTLRIAVFRTVYPMYDGFQTIMDVSTIPKGNGASELRMEKTRNGRTTAAGKNPASSVGDPGR